MTRPAGGWSSPSVIVQIVSQFVAFAMMVAGAWMMTQKDDSRQLNDRLDNHAEAIARLQVQIEFMRERGRQDGGAR